MSKRLLSWIALSKTIYQGSWRYVWCTVGVCFGVFLLRPLLTPIFLQQLFDQLEGGSPRTLLLLGGLLLALLGVVTALSYLLIVFSDAWFTHLTNHGTVNAFQSLYTIPRYRLDQRFPLEEQRNRIANGCSGSTGVFALLTQCITSLLCAAVMLLLLWQVSPLFLLYAALLVGVEALRVWVEGRANFRFQKELEEQSSQASGELLALLEGMEELAVRGAGEFYLERYRRHRERVWQVRRRRVLLKGCLDALGETALLGALLGSYTQLARQTGSGLSSLGELASSQSLFSSFTANFSLTRSTLANLPGAFATIQRLEETLDGASPQGPAPEPSPPRELPAVELQGLSLEGREGVLLSGLDLCIRQGEKVAVIGPNGCGKSVLLRAILGQHPIRSGRILLWGEEAAQLTPSQRRAWLSYCPPDFQLYQVTGLENIGMGASDGEAALPDTGEADRTYLKKRPEQLSEGQRQRVAIYRCLAGTAALTLADEPDSALDASQAERFLDSLIRHSDTLVVITHNPAMLDRFTRVVDLQPYAAQAAGSQKSS